MCDASMSVMRIRSFHSTKNRPIRLKKLSVSGYQNLRPLLLSSGVYGCGCARVSVRNVTRGDLWEHPSGAICVCWTARATVRLSRRDGIYLSFTEDMTEEINGHVLKDLSRWKRLIIYRTSWNIQ